MWGAGVSAALAGAIGFLAGGLTVFVVLRARARRFVPRRLRVIAMELHAIFNVLNRLAMTMPHEHEQDAVDRLSQYLRAHHRFARPAPAEGASAVEDAVGHYWWLTRWLAADEGERGAGLEWAWQPGALELAGDSPELAQAIEQGLRQFEGLAVAGLHIGIGIDKACDGIRARVRLRYELGPHASDAVPHAPAAPRGIGAGRHETLLRVPIVVL